VRLGFRARAGGRSRPSGRLVSAQRAAGLGPAGGRSRPSGRLVSAQRAAGGWYGEPVTTTPSLAELAAFANRLADASGEVIRPWFRATLDVVDKGTGRAGFDPVTAADREGEIALRRLIKETYPTHGILGEEHGRESGADPLTWVLDPIDGTRAFICGMTQWGTLIALNDGTRPILGVFDQPVTGERWIGHSGQAQFVAASKTTTLRTRACADLASAVITTTHPTGYFTKAEQDAFQQLGAAAKMTRYGGDCYAYGLLAMGFIDLVIEASLKPWDVQALIPIVEGAGGLLTSWTGGDAQEGGRVIAAGDPRVHAQALEVLRKVV
jgi:histidinol phosphatase-like enzyme (inositol monophosphatase family)